MSIFLKIIYNLIKALIIAVSSAFFVSIFDIATLFSFIPTTRTFVVSNSIYLAILVGLFSILEELYSFNCLKYDMFFSPDTDKRNERETPTVVLKEGIGYAKFYLDISIIGREKKFKKHKIIIYFSEAITLQSDVKQQGFVQIDTSKRVCEIDVSKLINEESKLITTANSKISLSVLQKETFLGTDKTLNVDIKCGNIFTKWFFIKKKSNQLKIKIKG